MVRRDQVETPAQRCGNSDGDESRRLLVDAAQRMSPLAQKYLEDEPQAAALLLEQAQRRLEQAQRRLEQHELAELRRYVATQFRRGGSDEPVDGLAERLETRRVVLQLGRANLRDVLDVACARFSRWAGGPTAAQLSKALRERWAASSPVVGAGVAVPHLPLAALRWRRRW
jgi:hypothetical protein